MKKYVLIASAVILLILQSCGSGKRAVKQTTQTQSYSVNFNLELQENPMVSRYANLDFGVRLDVRDSRAKKELIQTYNTSYATISSVKVNPGIGSFTSESVRSYMRKMGFYMEMDAATDYLLELSIKEFHVDYFSGIGWRGTVIMNVALRDANRTLVYPNVEVVGRETITASENSFTAANQALNRAFAKALKDINWDRIAYNLHRASTPKQEANKKVTGDGSTALEHLVVHWNVNSRPQGADIFWRVISKTPDVKSQNYRYLETTPYEGNETLNIKGLSYNNAGSVQIEVKVEKEGYYSQTKRYDVLSLIDDNDVNYMFRLVKEK